MSENRPEELLSETPSSFLFVLCAGWHPYPPGIQACGPSSSLSYHLSPTFKQCQGPAFCFVKSLSYLSYPFAFRSLTPPTCAVESIS